MGPVWELAKTTRSV